MAYVYAAYDSRVVANTFLDLARQDGEALDPMRLLKLVYIAHGWYLAYRKRPLIADDVEAWTHGPVIPNLYHEIKKFGARPVSEYYTETDMSTLTTVIPVVNDDTLPILREVWKAYRRFSGVQLSAMTHAPGTPWSQAYDPRVRHKVIPTPVIQQHYEERLQRSREPKAHV